MGDKQCIHYWKIDQRSIGRCCYCGAVKDFRALLQREKKGRGYQRCDECHDYYLIVFRCKDEKKRCALCKEKFDREE